MKTLLNWFKSLFTRKDLPSKNLGLYTDGWVSGKVVHIPTHPSRQPKYFVGPLAIVWHYTATDGGARGMALRRIGPRDHSKKSDPSTSWHFTIDRDGTLYQMLPTNRGGWHARCRLADADNKIENYPPNNCSIGIELVGKGDSFTEEQCATARELIQVLAIDKHYGHAWISPGRKPDPGPVWGRLLRGFPETAGHKILLGDGNDS